MGRFIDLTNKTFGRLTVIDRSKRTDSSGNVYWFCECECSKITEVLGCNLKSGHTTSCGCYNKEVNSKLQTKHGKHGTPEYYSWQHMLRRCYDSKEPNYHNYGGRGIVVTDRWQGKDGFINFYNDMGPRPSDEYSIDRINVNGNYELSNCQWASSKDQARNRRNNKINNIQEANYIRTLYSIGDYTQKELSIMYNCSQSNISGIIRGTIWN